MELKEKKIILIIIIAIIFIISLFWFLNRIFGSKETLPTTQYQQYALEDFPLADKYLDEEAKLRYIIELNKRYKSLATGEGGRTRYQNWLDIGVYKKAFGDLKGSEAAWLEAAGLLDDPYIAYGNLANLYLYFTKELAKAEEYYVKALEFSPPEASYSYYLGLADLYRYDWSKTHRDQVERVILEGIASDDKSNESYYNYLIRFFEEVGDEENVNKYQKLLKAS